MPGLPSVNHQRAIKAFEKAGFWRDDEAIVTAYPLEEEHDH